MNEKGKLAPPPLPSKAIRKAVMKKHRLSYQKFWRRYRERRDLKLVEEVLTLMEEEEARTKALNKKIMELGNETE